MRSRESVLDCGCLLPLWSGALTSPTRTEAFNAGPLGKLDVRPARTSVSKASEDCRSPKPGGIPPPREKSRSVVDCGCPLPLWNGALTSPTRTETFHAVPMGKLDVRPARTSVSKASADCRSPKPGGIPPTARSREGVSHHWQLGFTLLSGKRSPLDWAHERIQGSAGRW